MHDDVKHSRSSTDVRMQEISQSRDLYIHDTRIYQSCLLLLNLAFGGSLTRLARRSNGAVLAGTWWRKICRG